MSDRYERKIYIPLETTPGTAVAPTFLATEPATCRRCHRPFNPTDNTANGAARYGETPFCRRCVDRCHESTDAFHECPVCAGGAR